MGTKKCANKDMHVAFQGQLKAHQTPQKTKCFTHSKPLMNSTTSFALQFQGTRLLDASHAWKIEHDTQEFHLHCCSPPRGTQEHFHCHGNSTLQSGAPRKYTRKLAHASDSLVRVSRRVKWNITFMQWARLAPLNQTHRGTAPSDKDKAAYHVRTYSQHTICMSLMHVWCWHAASSWHAKQDTLYTHTSTEMHKICTLLDVCKLQSC